MKRRILTGAIIALGLFFIFGALNSWHIHRLDELMRTRIESYSKKNLPFDIYPGKTEIQLLPFNVKIKDIRVVPKGDLKKKLKDLQIGQIQLSPSFLHLFIGKLHLSYLNVDQVHLKMNIPIIDDGTDTTINFDKILRDIPVSQVKLERTSLDLKLSTSSGLYTVLADDIYSLITNDVSSVALQLKVPTLTALLGKEAIVKNAQLETHLFLTNKNLLLSDLKIKEGPSFIIASGSTQHQITKKTLKSANINVRTQIDAARVHIAYELFKPNDEENPLKQLLGQLRADVQIKATGLQRVTALIQSDIQGLSYEKFKIGNLGFIGEFQSKPNEVLLKKARLETPGIDAEINDLKLNLKNLIFSDVDVTLKRFELYKFLEYALNNKVPANGEGQGKFNCSGNLKNFNIVCPGSLTAENMIVKTAGKKDLVKLDKIAATGTAIINAKEVSFDAELHTEKSTGSSHGVINYKNGFDINFETTALNLDEVKKISVLEVDGIAAISGFTRGNSKTGIFEINFDGKNIHLAKYNLGDVSLNLSYQSGSIYANKVQGTLVSSRYLGQVMIDLRKDWITGKVQFPFIDLTVAKEAIKEHLPIPVFVAGSGSAIVDIDGPLNPDKLSFKSKARLYNCIIDRQHFDTSDVDISSELGLVNLNSVSLEEKNSNLNLTGTIDLTEKSYNIKFKSQRYYLDDLEYVSTMNIPAKGLFAIDGIINGKFNSPGIEGKFSSANFNLSGENLSPINGAFSVNHNKIMATISGPNELKFSYKDLLSSPDVHIEGNAKDINLAPLATSILGIKQLDDYHIMTSANLSVRIDKKDRSKINGYIFLPSLSLQFQKSDLKNEKEVSFFFTNGKLNFAPFLLTGKTGKLEFKSSSNSVSPIDMQISGLFGLSFLHVFAPFLETLEGLVSLNVRMRGDMTKLHFTGSSFIEDGFIKLPDIQHAAEEVKIDILFNQDQVIVNSIKGKFASGQLLGDGTVLLKGKKNFPLNLNLHLDNIDLNLPAQVNTKGNAELRLTGNWMPFTLHGTYQVYDGLITKELGGSSESAGNPHQVFLPPVLRADTSSPVILDMEIIPTAGIKIKNSLLDGKAEGKIRITGNPQSPVMAGNIILTKNSQINFMDVIFKVRDSNFVLNGSSPPNPALYLVAETRYRGYDIEMLVQGTAEKPKFKWSSSPALTEPQIISLLTLGSPVLQAISGDSGTSTSTLTTNTAPTNQSGTTTGVGLQNSQQSGAGLFKQNPLSRELKNRFGFDIQFSSKFDTANSVAVPKISAARQINDKASFIYSYQTGRDSRSDATLRYQLTKDIAGTANVTSQKQEDATTLKGNTQIRNDNIGFDLEYRKEFK
jgi:autotransporter translocation and assembly factor TamB